MTEARLAKMIRHYCEVTESLVFASPDIDNLPVTKDQYEQIAAAIPAPLGKWKKFDAERQTLIKAALTRILNTLDLSPNTYEIASKSLKG